MKVFALLFILLIKPSESEYSWKPIFKANITGCCNDRLECNEINNKPSYIGVDAAFRSTPGDGEHMFTLTYRSIVATLFEFGPDLVPKYNGYSVMSVEGSKTSKLALMSEICGHADKEYAPKGFLTAGFIYQNRIYVVCKDSTYEINHLGNGIDSADKADKIISKHARTDCNNQPHPALCLKQGEVDSLIDIIALPTSKPDQFFVLAFHGETQVTDLHYYRRTYMVKAFRNKDYVTTSNFFGWLSAVEWYKVQNKSVLGYYFTNDGNACHFKRPLDSEELGIEDLTVPRIPCFAMTSFLSCPQPWCFDTRFDSSFTIKENGRFMIYFLRAIYYWRLIQRPLPLNIPRNSEAIFTGLAYYSACGISENNPELKGKVLPCVLMQTDLAFARYDKQGNEHVYILKPQHGHNYYRITNKKSNNNKPTDLKGNPLVPRGDAAWYNNIESTVYITRYRQYYAYRVDDGEKFTSVKNGSLADFGIDDPTIDAIVNFDDTGYFFTSRSWFYVIPEKGWNVAGKETRKSRLVFIDFFSVRSDCYYNDEQFFFDLVLRYGIASKDIPPPPSYIFDNMQGGEGAGDYLAYIIIIIATGIAIAILACFIMWRKGAEEESDDEEPDSTYGGGENVLESDARRRKRLALEKKNKERQFEKALDKRRAKKKPQTFESGKVPKSVKTKTRSGSKSIRNKV